MSTLTDGTTTIELHHWTSFEGRQEVPTRVHPLMGGGNAITLAPARPRSAKLGFLFQTEDEARECAVMLATVGVLTIDDPARPTLSMQFVTAGDIDTGLDDDNESFVVTADVQEIGAA